MKNVTYLCNCWAHDNTELSALVQPLQSRKAVPRSPVTKSRVQMRYCQKNR